MYIITGRIGIVNVDNVKMITLDDRFIHAVFTDGTNKIIGAYRDAERAKDVYESMLYSAFPETYEVQNDLVYYSHVKNRDVYYLPEE